MQLCQLYLEGTFEHMQPVARGASSPSTSGPDSVHTQLGSNSALAQRYCISRSPSEAASPSAGNAAVHTPFMSQTPAAAHVLARAQQQEEQRYRAPPAAAAAASAAATTVDAINHHLLSERVGRIESAVATMATTVAQLVQLLSVAAESSPQAAAAIWSTAAQLTAVEAPAALSSQGSAVLDDGGASAGAAGEFSRASGRVQRAQGSCASAAACSGSSFSSGADHEAGGIAAPEFNLRRRIVRVADLHERLCAVPSGLPAHEAVTVTRH